MIILPVLLGAIDIFEKLGGYVASLRATARQKGELSPEQDAALDARIKSITSAEHWHPHDPHPGPNGD